MRGLCHGGLVYAALRSQAAFFQHADLSCAVGDKRLLKLALTALEGEQIVIPLDSLDPDYPHDGPALGAKRTHDGLGGMRAVGRDGHDAPPTLQAGAR
jgi:hypothetical protein